MVGYNPDQNPLFSSENYEAGLASGIATRMIIQPLDVLKIRFQLQEEPIHGQSSGKYKGLLQSIRLISQEEGVRSFWKGHVPAQGLSAIYGLVQFSTFEFLSREVGNRQSVRSFSDFFCGGLSGCVAMTAAMPLDVIRTRLVAQSGKAVYTGTTHAMIHIWRKEGLVGYFRGWIPSVAQIAPFTGIQFALYNCFIGGWSRFIVHHESTGSLVCGALAGTVAKTVLYPLDMVRHRLQMNGFERIGFGQTSDYQIGMLRTIVMVVRKESVYAQALCFTISKLVFGYVSDRTSPVRILSVGLALNAVSSLFFGILLLFAGCMQGASWVPATKLVARWYSGRSYGKMFSILGCGSAMAGMLMPFVEVYYWRSFLMYIGLSAFTFAVIQCIVLREDDLQSVQVKNNGSISKMISLVYSPAIWNVATMYFFSIEVRTICETWIPLYIVENGLSHTTFQISYEIGGVLGNLCSGMVLDYLSLHITMDSDPSSVFAHVFSLCHCGVFFQQYVFIVGWLLGALVNASINIWCMTASRMGENRISGSISALVSFLASFGSVLAGSPLAYLIDVIGYECFVPFFFTHIPIVAVIASMNRELSVEKTK
uniref:MFS domain-containing protein n=1 Tax=Angiostrongylus cantonensis TaxID=6313 RepID=A0A158PAZ2_ANGCA